MRTGTVFLCKTVNFVLRTLYSARLITCLIRDRYFAANIVVYLRTLSAPSCSLLRLSSSFFNGVHPLPIRIIIRSLRTASLYAIHFGGLRPCSASPKITVVDIIDRRCLQPSASRSPVNGLGKLGRFARSCKMKFRDEGQMEWQENRVRKMQYYFEQDLRRMSHSFRTYQRQAWRRWYLQWRMRGKSKHTNFYLYARILNTLIATKMYFLWLSARFNA